MSVANLKVGLIGLGRMGQNHLRVLAMLKGVELKFIYDVDQTIAKRLASTHGTVAVTDLNEALGNVEAVIICTPTVTHVEYIRLAAAKVRHIFIEKPLADTLTDAENVSTFANEKKINVQVGFIERFNPAVQALKKVLDQSSLVISVDFTRTNKISSRITDVDVVADLMIHDIDLALYLNGPALRVSAHGYAQHKMIDFASALITHENGRFSRIQASRITEKRVRSIQATCQDKFVDCDLLKKEIVITKQSELRQLEGEPYIISAIEETVEVRPVEALVSELQAFVASCHDESSTVGASLYAGLDAMKICDQIQKAVVA